MTHDAPTPDRDLQIRTPCPKRWEDLVGGDDRRFCTQCSLHVVDGSRLTRDAARALVANATERVCMRLVVDESGRPLHADTVPAESLNTVTATRKVTPPRRWVATTRRWAMLTTAALLAACRRDVPATSAGDPRLDPSTGENGAACTTILGKVRGVEELGDVAIQQPDDPEQPANGGAAPTPEPKPVPERLGEVGIPEPPVAPVAPANPPSAPSPR